MPRIARALLLAAAAAWLTPQSVARGAPASGTSVTPGRYILHGTARANATALPSREGPIDILALVAAGDQPRTVRLHLMSRGHACELHARREAGDRLALSPGQTCRVEVDEPDGRGEVEARLRSGTGRLTERDLSLELAWELSGSLSTASGSSVTIPGTSVEVPVPGGAVIPVRGTVQVQASGRRERPISGPPRG